jgi:hypothetical protein
MAPMGSFKRPPGGDIPCTGTQGDKALPLREKHSFDGLQQFAQYMPSHII